MTGQTIGLLLVMIIYLILMVGIGVLYSKKNNDVSDFYLGGRKLGPIVTAMSAEASDMSSWLLMGLPGVAYLSGCAEAGWTAIGLAIGTYLNWLIVAKRLRRYTHKANNSITLPAFFENRYRDKSHALMAISAIMIVIFFVPYTASGFAAAEDYRNETGDLTPMVILSTASPYKFPAAVLSAIGGDTGGDEFEQMERLQQMTGVPIPAPLASLKGKKEMHTDVIEKEAMSTYVLGL